MGEWEDIENWADIENDKPQDEALKKFRSVFSTSLSDSDLSPIKVNCFMKWIVVPNYFTQNDNWVKTFVDFGITTSFYESKEKNRAKIKQK